MEEKNINGLLIEDDTDDTMLFMELLAEQSWSSFKFTFACASDLKGGLELLAKGGIEVVLLDLNLPDSRGLETLRKVLEQAPGIPVIVLTGMNDEALGLEALRHGAQDYQVKGDINGHAFRRSVSYAVERHRLLAEIRSVIDSAPDGMAVLGPKGLVLYANRAAAAFLGGTTAVVPGAPLPFALPEGGFDEFFFPEAGGGARAAEVRVSEIDWDGKPARLLALRDITELRRSERLQAEIEERRKLDKMKDDFIGVITHEMRAPLTIIKGVAGNLTDGAGGPLTKEQGEMLAIQSESIDRLERGVLRILELSRLESNKARINLQRVDAAKLLQEIAHTFRLVLDRRRLPLDLEADPALPEVCADPELFVQVLSNLIDNAMRFARARIRLSARAGEPGYVRFSVADDGRGIPEEHIPELFNKFVQVDRISKGTDYHGMGLGLAICKESIERQNGRIWVESRAGEGTTFHFQLPKYVIDRQPPRETE